TEEFLRLNEGGVIRFKPREPALELYATFAGHEIDRKKAAFLPFLLISFRVRKENPSEALRADPIPRDNLLWLGFQYRIGRTRAGQRRVSRRGQPNSLTLKFFAYCFHDGKRIDDISQATEEHEQHFRDSCRRDDFEHIGFGFTV